MGHTVGPDGLVAYEYVDEAAFDEPCLGLRPWLSVSVWEFGLTQRLGIMSLRQEKKRPKGACANKITLCGLDLRNASDAISLPPGEIRRAQEFPAQSFFDPWVTRIPLVASQELRGKADRWSIRNKALGQELHFIEKLLRSKQGPSSPKVDRVVIKQGRGDFWETMEIPRTHMCDPNWRGSTYKSAFYNTLPIAGGLSFCEEREHTARIGSDAILTACAAANHAGETFSFFDG